MKLVNLQVIKDELERLIRNYRFYSSTEAKYRYEAYKELSEWLDGLEVEEPSKDLEEAARRAAVDKPDTPLEFLMETPYDSVKEQKFIEGAMWQKRHNNIPQELVENYCEFIKEGGKNVCALINAVNACNAKKAECTSNDLEEEIELVKGDYEQVDVAWNNDFDFIARHFYELGLKEQLKNK